MADDARGTREPRTEPGVECRVSSVEKPPFVLSTLDTPTLDTRPSTRDTLATIAARCSGRVPQQPPTIRTPNFSMNSPSMSAIGSGSSGYNASPVPVLSGRPAFGMHDTGSDAFVG